MEITSKAVAKDAFSIPLSERAPPTSSRPCRTANRAPRTAHRRAAHRAPRTAHLMLGHRHRCPARTRDAQRKRRRHPAGGCAGASATVDRKGRIDTGNDSLSRERAVAVQRIRSAPPMPLSATRFGVSDRALGGPRFSAAIPRNPHRPNCPARTTNPRPDPGQRHPAMIVQPRADRLVGAAGHAPQTSRRSERGPNAGQDRPPPRRRRNVPSVR